jgi:hypothetical protein
LLDFDLSTFRIIKSFERNQTKEKLLFEICDLIYKPQSSDIWTSSTILNLFNYFIADNSYPLPSYSFTFLEFSNEINNCCNDDEASDLLLDPKNDMFYSLKQLDKCMKILQHFHICLTILDNEDVISIGNLMNSLPPSIPYSFFNSTHENPLDFIIIKELKLFF